MQARHFQASAPTAFLIHGFLGAGKTTLAKQIAATTGAVRLSADDWYLHLFGSGQPQHGVGTPAEDRLHGLLRRLWPDILRAGADVVLDMGLWTRQERDRSMQVVRDVGAIPVLLALVTDDQTALRRLEARAAREEAEFVITPETYFQLRDQFEPVTKDERALVLRT